MVETYFTSRTSLWLHSKSACVIVKPQLLDSTKALFEGSGIQVTVCSQRHLGAAIGYHCFADEYITEKVQVWPEEIQTLSNFA